MAEPRPAATIFLLSPAHVGGRRAQQLLSERAASPLAARLRSAGGAPLGEVFSFISALYFRGKLSYARRFALEQGQVHVITANRGLLSPDTPITHEDLRGFGAHDIDPDDPRYREPLQRDVDRLTGSRVVFLGSIATRKYLGVLMPSLGDRLIVPEVFIGLGDMSRGSLMLQAVRADLELGYIQAATIPLPPPPRRR